MSGFVGLFNLDGAPVDPALLQRMTDALAFRGPDARRTWVSGATGLGHALLRTSPEQSDETSPWSGGGDVWIAGDVRIDGRGDLARHLHACGAPNLTGRPDVEWVWHAYRAWGAACLDRLIGDFAFVIVDGPERRVFCARDHFGVKPFHYARVGQTLIVSNTLNCVRLHPAVSSRLNEAALADYLAFDYNRDVATTTFADIQRLPPAHALTATAVAVSVRRYWTLPVDGRVRYRKAQDYVEHFRQLFTEAVDDRLRTDRAAIFMSGGLDSTTVAAAVNRFGSPRDRACDLHAYTVVYDRLIPDEERKYTAIGAEALGIPVHFLAADDYQPYERWDEPGCQQPEPSNDVFVAVSADQYRQAGSRARVALTGYGGDPLLRYETDLVSAVKHLAWGPVVRDVSQALFVHRRLPPVSVRTSLKRLAGVQPWQPKLPTWLDRAAVEKYALRTRGIVDKNRTGRHPGRPDACDLLTDPFWPFRFETMDPGVTQVPLESRHPMFDVRVVNWVLSIPAVPWCQDKEILRRAGLGVLPDAIRLRPKTPLAGDAALTKVRATWTPPRVDLSRAAPELITELSLKDAEADDDALWSALRVTSLYRWLSCAGVASFG